MDARAHTAPGAHHAGLRVGALHLRVHHGGHGLPPALPTKPELTEAFGAALDGLIDPDDPAYWVVRRLNLPFRSDPRFGERALAEAFAEVLRAAVGRVLRGEIVDGIRRFDSRAVWLAECLWAQATDPGRTEWVFGRYADLAALPSADAVRLTLAAEPETARAALGHLARTGRARRFARAIGERGARGVLKLLLPAVGPAAMPGAFVARLATEQGAMPGRRTAPALSAVATELSEGPEAALPPLAALIAPGTGRSALSPGRPPGEAREWTGKSAPGLTAPQAGASASAAGHAVPTTRADDRGLGPSPEPRTLETDFAGVFVLWRSVRELGLLDLLPEGADAGPARLALAAALAGPDHAAAWADPALHWLAGHIPEAEVAPAAPPGLDRRLIGHLAEWRAPRPVTPTLRRVGRTWLLQDCETEDWLAIGPRRHVLLRAGALAGTPAEPSPNARDPSADLAFFDVAHWCARRGWALLARAAYGDFARRLHGLERSSAAWLWDRLLAGPGMLCPDGETYVALPRVPLDFVLRMGGLDGKAVEGARGTVRLRLPGPV